MKKRKLVNAFSAVMETRMAAKEKKYKKIPWWKNRGLFIELEEAVDKLHVVLDDGGCPEAIQEQAADVANFAMMIAGQADTKWRKFKND